MDRRTIIETIKALHDSPSCCPELKHATKSYLEALALEQAAAKTLVAEVNENITLVDELVAFAHSPQAVEKFGVEGAKLFTDNADALKARGEKYCNCSACVAALKILDNKAVLFV